jgi:single-stranded-DNA-specific exonuclease
MRLPNQRWRISDTNPERVSELVENTGLSPLLAQVLINRQIETPELAQVYINPESQTLPSPLEEFKDLAISVALLEEAIATNDQIAICGDYDADGMTSTALLLRALRYLGADVDYAIPSRMKDGYGINLRIVEEFANAGIGIILTVDNGISAYEPIARAVELGMGVIITDHHDLPEKLPPAHAILNPKLIPESSPYRGLAGVGVAYILAVTLAQKMGGSQELSDLLLELFTLGTIADLAPLVGVNRRWLKRGLGKLPKSQLTGIQELIKVAGVSDTQKQLKPDDIGFKLGPRINAVGRIGDPQIVIELLTTDNPGLAYGRAMQCEQLNSQRQRFCEQIERDAIALIEKTPIPWKCDRVLVVVKPDWHHGVIGIVASRLVERYGVPVFIGTYEEENLSILRGSARGIEEFNVFESLDYCRDLLGKFGGHKAAGGFSLPAQNLEAFVRRLSDFAHQCLKPEQLKPLVKIDTEANFDQLTPHLYQQIDSLQPWGIGNDFPVFWTPNVRVKEQQIVGKNHLKLTLAQDDNDTEMKAIAWRWGDYYPLPYRVDIAYKLQENVWNGNKNIELELVGIRLSNFDVAVNRRMNDERQMPCDEGNTPWNDERTPCAPTFDLKTPCNDTKETIFEYQGRTYACSWQESLNELQIKNDRGSILAVNRKKNTALLVNNRDISQEVDITQPHYSQLIDTAFSVLKK